MTTWVDSPGGPGGSAGWAVYGDNLITYATTGTIIGARQSTVANLTVSSPQVNLDLRTYALAAGWNGIATVNLTIAPGVTISSASAGTPALTIAGPLPGGASLVNNGTISAAGGAGGTGSGYLGVIDSPKASHVESVPGSAGVGGGTALYVTYSGVPVTNNGTIAGGGGGGGGGGGFTVPAPKGGVYYYAANGGSGGAGNVAGGAGPAGGAGNVAGGFPGTPGNVGGSTTGGAAVGSGSGAGGAGGSRGSAGSAGTGYAGGAAGAAVVGTANITWLATGTRIGPIS